MSQMNHNKIAVIDFGGQYAHLIAAKIRRLNVLAEIKQPEDPTETFKEYKGIVFSGSPALSSFGEDSDYNKEIFNLDLPILGLCFGHQEIAKYYGGTVIHGKQEWGRADLHILKKHPLFEGLEEVEQVWMSHFDSVSSLGPEFEELGYTVLDVNSEPHRYAAIGSDKLKRYGFQFHPEVDDSINGHVMLKNFVCGICGCEPSWNVENFLEEKLNQIRTQVGDNSVFLLASGGVDSTVAAVLLGRALGPDRVHLLHIDHGLMRQEESTRVIKAFKELGLGENLHFVDASEEFLDALKGAIQPEEKRRIIGNTFIEIFEREAEKRGFEKFLLGQGTIYPDTIETGGTRRADTIKTHHNRVPLIERMIEEGKVIEPLAELYKVEVRELGEMLGIPEELVWRQPFPGPGLGVRLLCSDGSSELNVEEFESLTAEINRSLKGYNLRGIPLPIKSVGVKADLRSYEHPALIEGDASWDNLLEAAGKIYKEVKGINRCVWNLGPKLSGTVRPLKAEVTRERLDLLRRADQLVMEGLKNHGLLREIWQCPTVFVPLEIDGKGSEFCIIRPVLSRRAMTATAAELPAELIKQLREALLSLPGISGLGYDLTSKPPGTIEWE
ncbi:MAG: glutamine-hydrolyzing GMP synthase [Candidatus Dadabacteria bacterium]|nr:MAG: glutamine-hydrolyzing GMP synthase [Candidatus Dadabacteria bacterium]